MFSLVKAMGSPFFFFFSPSLVITAAMEFLSLIGFNENVVNEIGQPETYLVLKRDDPGLLWLAKSSLETCISI